MLYQVYVLFFCFELEDYAPNSARYSELHKIRTLPLPALLFAYVTLKYFQCLKQAGHFSDRLPVMIWFPVHVMLSVDAMIRME